MSVAYSCMVHSSAMRRTRGMMKGIILGLQNSPNRAIGENIGGKLTARGGNDYIECSQQTMVTTPCTSLASVTGYHAIELQTGLQTLAILDSTRHTYTHPPRPTLCVAPISVAVSGSALLKSLGHSSSLLVCSNM